MWYGRWIWWLFSIGVLVNIYSVQQNRRGIGEWRESFKDWSKALRDSLKGENIRELFPQFDQEKYWEETKYWYESANQSTLDQYVNRLGKIALYLRLYKKWNRNPFTNEIDFRYKFTDPLTTLNDEVIRNCINGAKSCFDHIYESLLERQSGYLFPNNWNRKDMKLTTEIHEILSNPDGNFEFDTTTTYFMCWLTLNRFPLLIRLPYCSIPDKNNRWLMKDAVDPRFIPQVDDNYVVYSELDEIDWRCAQYSFCPDPCCGKSSMEDESCPSESNPCPANISCSFAAEKNVDLVSLAVNEWNVTCNCQEQFVFDRNLDVCIDLDECQEQLDNCSAISHQRCVNTIGDYMCVCELGFERSANGNCQPIYFAS